MRVFITRDGMGDACTEEVAEQFCVDLSPIEEAYKAEYMTDGGTVTIDLGLQSVEHTF